MKDKTSERINHTITYVFFILVAFWVVFPTFWMISNSFMSLKDQQAAFPLILPTHIDLSGWEYLVNNLGVLYLLRNSLGIASISTAIVIFITILSGYSLARFNFRGKALSLNLLLLTQFIPSVANLISLYVVLVKYAHLFDTWTALIIIYSGGGTILGTLLFSGFFTGLPINLEEASMIDGTSRLGAFWRVILPLMRPALITVGSFSWIGFWGEIQYASIFTNNNAARTLPVALKVLQTPYGSLSYSAQFALGSILAIPPIIIFLCFQKYFNPSLSASSWKGA